MKNWSGKKNGKYVFRKVMGKQTVQVTPQGDAALF